MALVRSLRSSTRLRLAEGRLRIDARAYRHACAMWQKRGLPFQELDEQAEVSLPEGTQLVLTSTSLNGLDLEKRFIVAAQARGIPSVSLLDFWSNYRRRFTSAENTLNCLPDRIAVMDAQARDEMISEGFDSARLIITGQPIFDDLAAWRTAFTSEKRQNGEADTDSARARMRCWWFSHHNPIPVSLEPTPPCQPTSDLTRGRWPAQLVSALEDGRRW